MAWNTVCLLLFLNGLCKAQHKISLLDINITNTELNNHIIPIQIWYPSEKNSNNGYPVMIFSPGWVCNNSWYDYIAYNLVPQGYIVAIPNDYSMGYTNSTETQKARSQRYILDWLRLNATKDTESQLYQQIGDKSIASGHSEGGGATLLSISNAAIGQTFTYQFDAAFLLSAGPAPANDEKKISKPVMVMTGSHDCMAKPKTCAFPIYHTIPNSTCKFLADITNATHCNFMKAPIVNQEVCQALDLCPGVDHKYDITQKAQEDIVNRYMTAFLKATLIDDNNQQDFDQIDKQIADDNSNGVMINSTSNCG